MAVVFARPSRNLAELDFELGPDAVDRFDRVPLLLGLADTHAARRDFDAAQARAAEAVNLARGACEGRPALLAGSLVTLGQIHQRAGQAAP